MAATANDLEAALIDDIGALYAEPLAFVRYAFPWGEPGPLEDAAGPDDWQVDILQTLTDELNKGLDTPEALQTAIQVAVSSGHGIGKAQPVDLQIDTPYGVTRFGDLRPGDVVFGSDGMPTRVESIHPQGVKSTYRVTMDDESSTVTCAEHLWTVKHRKRGWQTLTTAQIANDGPKAPNGNARLRKYALPKVEPVQYPRAWVPVDPYTLGAWLGDGDSRGSCITNMDWEVFEHIQRAGYALGKVERQRQNKSIRRYVRGINPALRLLGFLNGVNCYTKSVPDCYKHNSQAVREEVLRGLIDTDGFVTEWGTMQYTSASKQLADDVAWLVRSLGGKARMHNKSRARTCTLTLPDGMVPCYVERKRSRVRQQTQKRYLERYIDRIEPEGETECMCIKVAADDHIYLTNDFIPTHNTGLVAWIIIWFLSTRPNCQIVVTANSIAQLTGKTWREVAKWHRLAINEHWFQWTATKFYAKSAPATWFASAVPWSSNNPEAFAGTHESEVLIIFDEASRVADIIWETAAGALTTAGAMWLVFGNPTRNTGRFRECFGKERHRWITRQIDSRTAKMANTAQLQQWVDDYGEDSDYVRVRVRGLFPRVGDVQLIGMDVVERAMENALEPPVFAHFPKMIGVDVARFGDDMSIILRRQGPVVWQPRSFNRIDTMELAAHVVDEAREFGTQLVFVDGVGVGGGVVDRLRELGLDVVDVQSGEAATDHKRFKNRRMELWWRIKEWLDGDVSLPAGCNQLRDDLISPEYGFDSQLRMALESVESMKERGLASPDYASALAMTFADFTGGHRKARARNVRKVKWA